MKADIELTAPIPLSFFDFYGEPTMVLSGFRLDVLTAGYPSCPERFSAAASVATQP